jgi:Glycosyltransferase
MSSAPEILHRLETPHPFQPAPGYFRLEGWMFVRGPHGPSRARLRLGDRFFDPETIIERPDVAQAFPDEPNALRSGFRFLCFVEFGLYVGALEASNDGATWHHVRTFAIPVSSHPLLGAIEKPPPHTVIDQPVRIEGWCFHPEFEVSEVALRFGNIEVPCDYHVERPDVAGLFPQHPAARRAGFITSENLPRGSGKLRARVSTSCGRNYFLESTLRADIARGNDPKSSPLGTVRTPLTVPAAAHTRAPGSRPVRSFPPPGPRNILFALYGDFTCNSALHVAALANELIERGYDCVVAGPSHKETIIALPRARFIALEFAEWEDLPDYFVDHRGPSLIHAWTPRENVRLFTQRLCAAYDVPYFVHLEDHEPTLLETRLARTTPDLLALPPAELDALVPEHLSHPRRAPEFLAHAAGVTTIVEKLHELVPPDVPSLTFWPAADPQIYFPRDRDNALRASLGIAPDDTVLLYHGNVHAANADEVGSLYQAVALLNRRGRRTFLIRAGRDDAGLMDAHNAAAAGQVLHLGYVAPRFLPDVMRLADYFVQPGLPGAFNDYRFPSKLPEFFAIGRPVILPRTNLGTAVRHGIDAYVLDRADADNIAAAVLALHADPALAAALSAGALRFAAENFSWRRNTTRLLDFYRAHAPLTAAPA